MQELQDPRKHHPDLLDLPTEIQLEIFKLLSTSDRFQNLALTCKWLHNLLQHEPFPNCLFWNLQTLPSLQTVQDTLIKCNPVVGLKFKNASRSPDLEKLLIEVLQITQEHCSGTIEALEFIR